MRAGLKNTHVFFERKNIVALGLLQVGGVYPQPGIEFNGFSG